MENIKTYSDFELNENFSNELLEIPKSTIEGWIRSLDSQEDDLNQTIWAKESMQEFLDSYETNDPEEFVQPVEDTSIEEIDELSSDDENPTFIKKFEEL